MQYFLIKMCAPAEPGIAIWNSGTEHFYAKNYDIGADLIERSMLYVSRDEESRSRRTTASEYFAFAIWHFGISIELRSSSLRLKRY